MGPELSAHVALERGVALDVTLELTAGITVLFGPSGAGKSTLLAALAGLVRPTRGYVRVGGEVWLDVAAGVERPVHQRALAFVFQSLALFPHLTAAENVAYGIPNDPDRRARAEALLARMQVAHLADRRPGTFSGGEAQRVALARAFARTPKLLLLDEPFSAMDRRLRDELGAELTRLVDEAKIPAVLVTHHRREAVRLGREVLRMEGGRVVERGAPERVIAMED